MAKAPRPGVGKRADEVKAAKVVHKLRVKDETRTIALANVPIKERFAVRALSGKSLEDLMSTDSFGIDILMIVWWLAGRAAGSKSPIDQLDEDWPADLGEDDIEFFEVTADDEEDVTDPQS